MKNLILIIKQLIWKYKLSNLSETVLYKYAFSDKYCSFRAGHNFCKKLVNTNLKKFSENLEILNSVFNMIQKRIEQN